MRIIGGKYRGKKLYSPEGDMVRPTSDKTREAMFNILRSRKGCDFSGLNLLDVFCGSGAFSLEAVSQGFGFVTSVDVDIRNIQKNVKLFEAEKNKIKLIQTDVLRLNIKDNKYDVLFMDAPYNKGLTEPALEKAALCLRQGALCLIEVHKEEKCNLPNGYVQIDERKYGLAKIIIAVFEGM
ncbi:MAG: methyltransferase domain-containing protein [Alphaproteobacteria bacterium]|nr:methyltransferase domain-containing protein [Alphaproteobacteria bacterium]